MKLDGVYLNSWGYIEPRNFLLTDEIEDQLSETYERLKLSKGRLFLQTGIKRLGYWPIGTKPSTIAVGAALKTCDYQDSDLLIHASVCRDFLEPATAALIHHELGLSERCQFYDLSNACLGVMSSVLTAGSMIKAGVIKKALIVSGENSGPLLLKTLDLLKKDHSLTRKSIKKYMASLSIGSAGVALVISNQPSEHSFRVIGGSTLSDSSAVPLCQGSGSLDELTMETDSEKLMEAGIKLAKKNFSEFLDELSWTREMIKCYVPHQVGIHHRHHLLNQLEVSEDFTTFDQFGNTGSAALPLTFMKLLEAQSIKKNDKIAFLGIGSGLVSTMLGVEKC